MKNQNDSFKFKIKQFKRNYLFNSYHCVSSIIYYNNNIKKISQKIVYI